MVLARIYVVQIDSSSQGAFEEMRLERAAETACEKYVPTTCACLEHVSFQKGLFLLFLGQDSSG